MKSNTKQGSVLIAALMLALILGTVTFQFLNFSLQEYTKTERELLALETQLVSENYAQQAIAAMSMNDWTGWTKVGDDAYQVTNNPQVSEGIDAYVSARIEDMDSRTPSLQIVVRTENKLDQRQHKQLTVQLQRTSPFANGLVGVSEIYFRNNEVEIDSYNSDNGDYHHRKNRNDNATVLSHKVDTWSNGGGNAYIYGKVASNVDVDLGRNGRIYGEDSFSSTRIEEDRYYDYFIEDYQRVSAPETHNSFEHEYGDKYVRIGEHAQTTSHTVTNDFYIDHSQRVEIRGNAIIVATDDVDIRGVLEIAKNNSSLVLYVADDFRIQLGGEIRNKSEKPENFIVYSLKDQSDSNEATYVVRPNDPLYMAIYAPEANLQLGANDWWREGRMHGAIVADSINVSSDFQFHQDEALKDYYDNHSGFTPSGWNLENL